VERIAVRQICGDLSSISYFLVASINLCATIEGLVARGSYWELMSSVGLFIFTFTFIFIITTTITAWPD
jgi:hypothetical protein